MSSTPPLRQFPGSPADIQRVSVVLPRPVSASANFPNPNTHRFPSSAAIYSLSKPTAPGTGCLTSLAPLLETIDNPPARVRLPPTPPPKDTPPINGMRPSRTERAPPPIPPPPRTPDIAPSRQGGSTAEPQSPAPLHALPSTAFHGRPELPPRSALRPLNPRPRYVPSRPAPDPEEPPRLMVPALAMNVHRRRCCSWTAGIITFLIGLILFVVGVTFAGMNAHNDSSLTHTGVGVNIAAAVIGVFGFGGLTASATHLVWLFRSRKRKSRDQSRDSDAENRGGREDVTHDRTESKFWRADEAFSPAGIRSGTRFKRQGKSKEDIEIVPLSPPQGPPSRKDSSCSNSEPPSPPSVRQTHPAFEDTHSQRRGKWPERKNLSIRNASNISFLDLEDCISESVSEERLLEDVTLKTEDPLQSRPSGIGPSRSRSTRPSTRDLIASSRNPYITQTYRRRDTTVRPSTIEEVATPGGPATDRNQTMKHYTTSLDRLDKSKISSQQRYKSVSPFQDRRPSHLSNLAVRARADVATALGPSVRLNDVEALSRSKGKHKEVNHNVPNESSDSGAVRDSITKASIPSNLSAADQPFPFARARNTDLFTLGPSAHFRSSSDSQLPRPKISLDPSNSTFYLNVPRINRAHVRAAAASPVPSVDNTLNSLDLSSGPLLPATAYTPTLPTAPSFGDTGRGAIQQEGAAIARAGTTTNTTPSSSATLTTLVQRGSTHLAAPPDAAGASSPSTTDSPLQSSELASDRETWARRKRSMDRRWSQERGEGRARVRPLFRLVD